MVDQLQFEGISPAEAPPVERPRGGRRSVVEYVVGVLLLVIGLAAGWLVGRSSESPETLSDSMVETVGAWHEATEARDVGAVIALFAEDAVWHDEALDETYTGREAIRFAYESGFTGSETVTVEHVSISPDTAVLLWTFGGSNELTGISVLEFDGDEIVAETVYYDCAQSMMAASCANVP